MREEEKAREKTEKRIKELGEEEETQDRDGEAM